MDNEQLLQTEGPVFSGELHENEDPHSVPTPLQGTGEITSTDARRRMNDNFFKPSGYQPLGQYWT